MLIVFISLNPVTANKPFCERWKKPINWCRKIKFISISYFQHILDGYEVLYVYCYSAN